MSSSFGNNIKISVFGQSHGAAIGVVIDGLPAGESVDMERLEKFLSRRAPGSSPLTTSRKEADKPELLSGLQDGVTCGAPLCAVIKNSDTRSSDYERLKDIPRPSHADYPAFMRYNGFNDVRGGGHFSGRLTAPLCVAGGICLQILERRGITVGAHIASISSVKDDALDPVKVTQDLLAAVSGKELPVVSDGAGELMKAAITKAASEKDSVGGVIECCALGLPSGLGDPIFDGVENRLSAAIFGIPAVRGIEFGAGFAASSMRGSEHNDPYYFSGENVLTTTNNHGGVLGGITTGMPLIFRAAIKPTPSIGLEQDSVSLSQKLDTKLTVSGRHDPCIVPRAVPVIEAVTAAVLLDMLMSDMNNWRNL